MGLIGRLTPNFKAIADFRRDNGTGIRNVCRRFVAVCRDLRLFSQALVAVDGSKFKAVNTRDKNFIMAKIDKLQQQFEESSAMSSSSTEFFSEATALEKMCEAKDAQLLSSSTEYDHPTANLDKR